MSQGLNIIVHSSLTILDQRKCGMWFPHHSLDKMFRGKRCIRYLYTYVVKSSNLNIKMCRKRGQNKRKVEIFKRKVLVK